MKRRLRPTYLTCVIDQYRDFSLKICLTTKDDPYTILGIDEGTPYKVAKKRFLKIAMEHHPDTANVKADEDRNRLRDVFITARLAFEKLIETPDGFIMLKEDASQLGNFDDWFKKETGMRNPFDVDLDPQTMKEVAEMTEECGGGLDRDGGMWQLAKSITAIHNSGGNADSVFRLEAGEISYRHRTIDGELRRRRK
jgi:hypothetical protein